MLFSERRETAAMGGPIGRGQYSNEHAEMYLAAAEEFEKVTVTVVAKEGEKMFAYGGSVVIGEGNVGLEISGHSDDDPGAKLDSFYALARKMIADEEERMAEEEAKAAAAAEAAETEN